MFSTGGVFGLLLIVVTIVLIVIVMKRKKKKEKGICQEMKKRFTLRTILNLFIVCLFVSLIQKFIIELSHKELLYHNNNKPNFNHNQQK
jgi:multisubunit Na+/H+ antiporter MnhB subunit